MDRPDTTSPDTESAERFIADDTVHLQFPGEQQPIAASLSNLSEDGLFVVSEITYPASTEFNFRISSAGEGGAITGRGRVAWRRQLAAGAHRPPGMGCEIVRLTDGGRNALTTRLLNSQDEAIDRTPPDRRSLSHEINQQSIAEALGTQRIEREEYLSTFRGTQVQPDAKAGKRPMLVAAAILLLAVAGYALYTSGLLDPLLQPLLNP